MAKYWIITGGRKLKNLYLFISSIIILLFFNSVDVNAATTPQIAAGKVNAESGAVVEVPLTISENPGICGGIIRVEYDSKMTLKGVTKGEALSKLNMTEPGDLAENPVNIGWDGVDADNSNGVIAVLSFQVPSDNGTYSITLSCNDGDIVDGELNSIAPQFVNGEITVGKNEANETTDETAADDVIKLINAIDDNNKSTITEARNAYDALTDEQKAKISSQDLRKLTDAEDAVKKIEKDEEDKKAAFEVEKLINELPETIGSNNEEQVKNVINAYNNLTEEQKAFVDNASVKKLNNAENQINNKKDNVEASGKANSEDGNTTQQSTDSSVTAPETEPTTQSDIVNVDKPAKVTLKYAKNSAKKAIKISWKKMTVNGYEVQIALNKKFTKSKKTISSTNTTLTVKKLKKKKTYYVRVRAFNKDGSNKIYGSWSKIKKVKIKK